MLICVPLEMQENIVCQMDNRWEKKCSFLTVVTMERKILQKVAAPFSRFCFRCIMHDEPHRVHSCSFGALSE